MHDITRKKYERKKQIMITGMPRKILICDLLDNGNGTKAVEYDKVLYVPKLQVCTNGTLIHSHELVEFFLDDIIIFSANEDGMHFVKSINMTIHTLCAKLLEIRKAIKTQFPNMTIYNDPIHFEDTGDKLQSYKLLKHLPYVPRFAEYTRNTDWNIFPCIVSANRASGGRFRALCHDAEELHREGTRIQRVKGGTFITEYIDSRIEDFGCFHNLRFMVVNDTLVDWFCRPGNGWNIHTRTQNAAVIPRADSWAESWLQEHDTLVKKLLSDMYGVLGKGAFAYDLIIKGDMLYLCEIGYKFWDDTVAKLIDFKKYKLTKDVEKYKTIMNGYIK
jgi:hypothetical protein